MKIGDKVILKEGEYEKLPTPVSYNGFNIMQHHNIPKDTIFTVVNEEKCAVDHTVLFYEGNVRRIQIRTARLISINDQRDAKLKQIGI